MSTDTPFYNAVVHTLKKELSESFLKDTERHETIPVKVTESLVYYRHMLYIPKIGDKVVMCTVEFPKDLQGNGLGSHAARYYYQHGIMPKIGRDGLFDSFFQGEPKKLTEMDLFFAANEGEFVLTNATLEPYRQLHQMAEGIHKVFDDRTCVSTVHVDNGENAIVFVHNVVPSMF